jgi:hypothetical protein
VPAIKTTTGIRTTHSCAVDARAAAREFHAGVCQENLAAAVFFCSSHYDLDAIADELRTLFDDTLVVGCTTAGEIGPAGYLSNSLSGFSLSREVCTAVAARLDGLADFTPAAGEEFGRSLLHQLQAKAPGADASNTFALQLIDGMSMREESVTWTVQGALGDIALIGGSAGDDVRFERTWVYHDGAFHTGSALVLLATVTQPFCTFNTQHFQTLDERVVVTAADPDRRVVLELNGLPAIEEYARLVGSTADRLDPLQFAAYPVVVRIDGNDYVRSIHKLSDDGGLAFFSAIEEGVVLRAAHGEDLVGNLDRAFADVRRAIGRPAVVVGCDCILRNLEIRRSGLTEDVQRILQANNTVGFSTYGEQCDGLHVNQTFTAIAIGGGGDD